MFHAGPAPLETGHKYPAHKKRMSDLRVRQAIAFEAARLMYDRVESEYFTAKRKAAKRLCRGHFKPNDLPSNAEIRELIQVFARTQEGEARTQNLRDMRLHALNLMRLLRRFRSATQEIAVMRPSGPSHLPASRTVS